MKRFSLIAAAAACFFASASCTPDKSVLLFDGETLNGWTAVAEGCQTAPEGMFSVKDGCICISGDPFGYIYTDESYSDFTLEAEWCWVGEPTNSGIFLLIQDTFNPFPNCVECNLQAGKAGDFVLLGGATLDEYVLPEGGLTSKFPKMEKFEASSEKPAGEWNKALIEVKDGHIKVFINDVFQNEGTCPCKEGRIGLQSEGGPVMFRSVKLTPNV